MTRGMASATEAAVLELEAGGDLRPRKRSRDQCVDVERTADVGRAASAVPAHTLVPDRATDVWTWKSSGAVASNPKLPAPVRVRKP